MKKNRVYDIFGSKEVDVDIPVIAAMKRLIPALANKMNLPFLLSDGQQISYRFFRAKTEILLFESDTMQSIGANEGELFLCIPEIWPIKGPSESNTESRSKKQKTKIAEPDIRISSAPIYIPDNDELAIKLVKGETVYELERCRSDEIIFSSIMWTFVGAVLGVIINWVTSFPIRITTASLVTLFLLVLFSILMKMISSEYKHRADKKSMKLHGAWVILVS
jgi:hypothetical protein